MKVEIETYLIDKWASDVMIEFVIDNLKNENRDSKLISKLSYDLAYEMWNARQQRIK